MLGRRVDEVQSGTRSAVRLDDEALVRAIREGQLRLWYQPIVSLDDDDVVGVEALARWQHPELGLVGPGDFIPAAERTGRIVDVGRWVLHEGCRQAAEWRRRGRRLQVSINVGARHVDDPGFEQDVRDALDSQGLDPSALCLEITEAVPISASEAGLARLARLRRDGVRIALDDFGTGCSSLATLVRVEIDELKVDRLFVQGLDVEDHANHALVTAVLGLAGSLGLDVVAEGIETGAQLRELRALGCPFGQGFLYQRPLPAEELEAWVHQRDLLRTERPRPVASNRLFSRRGDRSGPASLRFGATAAGVVA